LHIGPRPRRASAQAPDRRGGPNRLLSAGTRTPAIYVSAPLLARWRHRGAAPATASFTDYGLPAGAEELSRRGRIGPGRSTDRPPQFRHRISAATRRPSRPLSGYRGVRDFISRRPRPRAGTHTPAAFFDSKIRLFDGFLGLSRPPVVIGPGSRAGTTGECAATYAVQRPAIPFRDRLAHLPWVRHGPVVPSGLDVGGAQGPLNQHGPRSPHPVCSAQARPYRRK